MEVAVIWSQQALTALDGLFRYIARSSPDHAVEFIDAMLDFGESLQHLSGRYPVCRYPNLSARKFRCAVFRKNYLFIYKKRDHELRIYHIVRTSQMTESFDL